MEFAVAQNAAIMQDDGRRVTYHPRCPYCGYLDNRCTSSVVVSSRNKAGAGSQRCKECNKSFSITVIRN